MAAITTRAGKGTPLTNAEVDANFTGLNADKEAIANKGVANGYAGLDATGKVPAGQLPSYVDDVLEFANLAGFPITGETGKIYIAVDTNKTYRWSGSTYIYITSGAVDSVAGKTGVVTLVKGDVGLGSVDNKSSATILGELSSVNVTTALGYTPYSAANPNGYIAVSSVTWGNLGGKPTTLSGYGITDAQAALGFTPVQQGGGTGQLTNKVYIGWTAGSTLNLQVDTTNFGANWPISVSGNAATATTASACSGNAATATNATTAKYLDGTQQTAGFLGMSASMSMSADSGATRGSVVHRATGTGDANLAGETFWNDAYAIKLGIRADGYFGLGGWSREAWSWYSDPSGNMVAAGNVTAYSDPRLKERFARVENPLDILEKLDGGTFYWRQGFKHTAVKAGKRDYGILADQVERVMPEIVTDSIMIDDKSYKTVSYEKLVPVLIEAVKELNQRIIELEDSK